MKTKLLKRMLSLFVAATMMASAATNVIASDPSDRLTDKVTRAKLVASLMQYKGGIDKDNEGDQEEETLIIEPLESLNKVTGTEFFVVVQLKDLDKIVAATDGIYTVGFDLLYNDQYIKYADETTVRRMTNAQGARFGLQNPDSFYSDATDNAYEIISAGTTFDADEGSGKHRITYSLQASDPNARNNNNDVYLAAFRFALKDIPSNNVHDVISFPMENFSISFGQYGSTASYEYNLDDPEKQIATLFDVDDDAIDFYGNLEDKLASIAVSGEPVKDYIIPKDTTPSGVTFNPTGITVTPTMVSAGAQPEITPTAADYKGLKFYYADTADRTEANLSMSAANELTASTNLTLDHNDKYVYVTYTAGGITKAYCLGQLKVEENTITTIAVKKDGPTASTFGASGTSHHHYTTQNVLDVLDDDDDRLTVTLTYKDGSSKDVTYSGTVFDNNGIALYYKDAEDKLQKVVKEPTPTKFATGENVYYVALADGVEGQLASAVSIKTGDDDIKVTGLEDSIVLDSVTDPDKQFKYKDGGTIDLSSVEFTYHMASDASHSLTGDLSDLGDNYVVFWSDAPVTYDAGHVIESGTTTYDESTHKDKNIYIVEKSKTGTAAADAKKLGTLGTRAVDKAGTGVTGSVQSSTYGDTLEDKLSSPFTLGVGYDNGDTEDLTFDGVKDESNIKMRVKDEDGNVIDGKDNLDPNDPLTLTPDMKSVEFYIPGTSGGDVVLGTTALTVAQKEVHFAPQTEVEVKKTYDATATVEAADVTALNDDLKIVEGDLISADTDLADKVKVSGVTYAYDNANAGNDKDVTVDVSGATAVETGTGTAADAAKFNANYKLVPTAGTFADNKLSQKGEIEKYTLTFTTLEVPSRVADGAYDYDKTINITSASTPAACGSDVLTLTYKCTYPQDAPSNVPGAAPTVTIDTTSSGYGLSGAAAANYTLSAPTSGTGLILNKSVESVTIEKTKTEYTYPDTTLTLDDISVKVQFSGQDMSTVSPMTLEDFLASGTLTFTNKAGQSITVTPANYNTLEEQLAYGATELTFTYTGADAATTNSNVGKLTVTAKKKPIKLSEIEFNSQQPYGDAANQTNTYTFTGDNPIDV